MAATVDAKFPEKLDFLFRPMRYKVAYGGRSSGKSWGFARALLIQGMQDRHRVICAREIQNSIADSVHKLLSDQIEALGLGAFYTVQDQMIFGTNGTEIVFKGLGKQTTESIKSFEGATRVWVEEAKNVSESSWKILTPTIRAEGSEIWITFNPDLDTDPTYLRFVADPPSDCISVPMNYMDNPWFTDVMERERLDCMKRFPDDYPNIWLGKCRPAVEGAIYFKQMQEAERRICNVPYDPYLKVHLVMDLGYNDALGIALVQRQTSEIRIIHYIEESHQPLDYYSSLLKEMRLNWGKLWLPHDGFSRRIESGGKSVADIMKKLGWKVARREEIVELSIEDGIRNARMAFPRVYIDRTNCARLIECLKRYRRNVNQKTGASGTPVHDEFSHGADCFRYVCVNADKMHNEEEGFRMPHVPSYRPLDAVVGY